LTVRVSVELSEAASNGGREIVGNSAALKQALKRMETVAGTDSTALILGETGIGKERFATAIHQGVRRSTTLREDELRSDPRWTP